MSQTFDPNRLGAAESWRPENWDRLTLEWLHSTDEGRNAAAFIKLARQALDIQIRRGWSAARDFDGWCVIDDCCQVVRPDSYWPDPLTALVETEKRYGRHVEGKQE